ncbi:MAG: hypothetical protein ACI83P_002466 [Janthinobacterium sp.]|jgi:hypothetical protein
MTARSGPKRPSGIGLPSSLDGEFKRLRAMRACPLDCGTKVQMTVRLDADVIQAFKQAEDGWDGWQTRMNDALRNWLATHRVVRRGPGVQSARWPTGPGCVPVSAAGHWSRR